MGYLVTTMIRDSYLFAISFYTLHGSPLWNSSCAESASDLFDTVANVKKLSEFMDSSHSRNNRQSVPGAKGQGVTTQHWVDAASTSPTLIQY